MAPAAEEAARTGRSATSAVSTATPISRAPTAWPAGAARPRPRRHPPAARVGRPLRPPGSRPRRRRAWGPRAPRRDAPARRAASTAPRRRGRRAPAFQLSRACDVTATSTTSTASSPRGCRASKSSTEPRTTDKSGSGRLSAPQSSGIWWWMTNPGRRYAALTAASSRVSVPVWRGPCGDTTISSPASSSSGSSSPSRPASTIRSTSSAVKRRVLATRAGRSATSDTGSV